MASQPSDILSQYDSELFDTPSSPVLKRTLSTAFAFASASASASASVSASVSASTTANRRFSKVWNHTPVGRCDIIRNYQSKPIWRCRYCLKEYLESGGTKIIISHLKEHSIDISSAQETRTTSIQSNIADAFHKAEQTNHKRRCLSTIETQALDPAVIEQLYVRWITTCGVSFRMATLVEFRALLYYLNPEIDNWLPNSIPTIRTWTLRTYEAHKQQIKHKIQAALSKVHFTVDLWTSPNSLAILGIIAHYMSESGQLEHSVLALQELDSEHTG